MKVEAIDCFGLQLLTSKKRSDQLNRGMSFKTVGPGAVNDPILVRTEQ